MEAPRSRPAARRRLIAEFPTMLKQQSDEGLLDMLDTESDPLLRMMVEGEIEDRTQPADYNPLAAALARHAR